MLNFKRFFIIFILLSFVFTACRDIPCRDTLCDNSGIITFDQGDCYCRCPPSTRGLNCTINLTDSIEGTYAVYDTFLSGASVSNDNLVRTDSNIFRIVGLGNSPIPYNNCAVNLKINGEQILIDSQFLCNNSNITDAYLIYGSGFINYDLYVFNVNYYITHLMGTSNQIDTCVVYFKK